MPGQKSQAEFQQDDVAGTMPPAEQLVEVISPKPSRIPSTGQVLNTAKAAAPAILGEAGKLTGTFVVGAIWGRNSMSRTQALGQVIKGKPSSMKGWFKRSRKFLHI